MNDWLAGISADRVQRWLAIAVASLLQSEAPPRPIARTR